MSGGKKKGIRITAITLAALLVVGGALYAYFATRTGKAVEVVPVSQWELGWMPDQMTLYGGIESSDAQSIFADKDVTVTEVYVAVGDEVHIGDPLLAYDATLDAIDLDLKQMELQKLEYELVGYYKEYKKYARKDYISTLPSPSPSAALDTATGTAAFGSPFRGNAFGAISRLLLRAAPLFGSVDAPDETVTNGKSLSAGDIVRYLDLAALQGSTFYVRLTGTDRLGDYKIDMQFPTVNNVTYAPDASARIDRNTGATGSGTSGDPYVYQLAASSAGATTYLAAMSESFVSARLADAALAGASVYTELEDGLNASGAVIGAIFTRVSTNTPDPSDTPDPSETPEPTDDPGGGGGGGGGSGLSKAEKESLARAAAKQIRDAELEYKQLRLDIQTLALRGTDGVIRATIDGLVSAANDPADTANGELLVQVKGSEGYFVRCSVDETNLAKVPVGAELSGYSYDSGASCTGRVVEVGTIPLSNMYYGGNGRSVSRYLVRIFIEDGTSLMPGYYIEFTLEPTGGGEETSGALYLHQAYIREKDGMKYVCVARDGVLRLVTVETGKVMYGYIEITNGAITREDYIAFPYSKDAKDGAPVTMPEDAPIY